MCVSWRLLSFISAFVSFHHEPPEEALINFLLSFTPVLENNVKFRLLLPELYPESPRCLQRSVCACTCVYQVWVNMQRIVHGCVCTCARASVCVSFWFFFNGVSCFSRTGLTLTWCFCSLEKCAAGAEALRNDRLGAAGGHDERRHLLPPNANHENTYSPWNLRDDQENQNNHWSWSVILTLHVLHLKICKLKLSPMGSQHFQNLKKIVWASAAWW